MTDCHVIGFGQVQLAYLVTSTEPSEAQDEHGLHSETVLIMGWQETLDTRTHHVSLPQTTIHPQIIDKFDADIICADHSTHDGNCGIFSLAELSQITPAETYDLRADVIHLRLLRSNRIPHLTNKSDVSFPQAAHTSAQSIPIRSGCLGAMEPSLALHRPDADHSPRLRGTSVWPAGRYHRRTTSCF